MRGSGFDAEVDVGVVGGGSAGCVLSARLTENPEVSLCVMGAGGRDRNPWIHVPMGFGKLVPNPKMSWGYETEPEQGLGGRPERLHAPGRVPRFVRLEQYVHGRAVESALAHGGATGAVVAVTQPVFGVRRREQASGLGGQPRPVRRGMDLAVVSAGKMSMRDVPYVEKLLKRGILHSPRILPRFMATESLEARRALFRLFSREDVKDFYNIHSKVTR